MIKNSKTDGKSATPDLDFATEIDSVQSMDKYSENNNYALSGYTMFDGPKVEIEQMNRYYAKAVSSYTKPDEEFHWMAKAAYNQSK